MQGKSKEKLFQRKNHNRTLFMTSRIHNSRMEALNTRISHILVLLSIVRFIHMTKRRSISIGLFYLSNLFSAWIFDEWLANTTTTRFAQGFFFLSNVIYTNYFISSFYKWYDEWSLISKNVMLEISPIEN